MEAPRCRLCGKREWHHQCGGLPGSVTRDLAPHGSVTVLEPVTNHTKPVTNRERQRKWREAHRDKSRVSAVERKHRAKPKA